MMSRIVRTRVVIAAVVVGPPRGLLRRRRRPPPPSGDLSASDPYSDLQLGRGPVTHDPRDEASASQIGDPPEGRDPLI